MTSTPIQRTRELVEKSGVPAEDFAARVGMDPDRLAKILAGERRPSSTDAALIAMSGKATVDWLFDFSPYPEARAHIQTLLDEGRVPREAVVYSDDVVHALQLAGFEMVSGQELSRQAHVRTSLRRELREANAEVEKLRALLLTEKTGEA